MVHSRNSITIFLFYFPSGKGQWGWAWTARGLMVEAAQLGVVWWMLCWQDGCDALQRPCRVPVVLPFTLTFIFWSAVIRNEWEGFNQLNYMLHLLIWVLPRWRPLQRWWSPRIAAWSARVLCSPCTALMKQASASESPRWRSCPWSNTFSSKSRNINGKIRIKAQNFYLQIFAISKILRNTVYHKITKKTIWMWIYQTWSITQDYLFTELKLTLASSWGLHRCFCVEHWWVSWWWRARWRFGSATTPEEDEELKTSTKLQKHHQQCVWECVSACLQGSLVWREPLYWREGFWL